MSAMVSSGMRRKRLPSREREASMGMSARARAMISLGCGVAGLFTLQSSGPLGMSGIRWGFQITSFHGAAVATLPAGCIGPRQAERYSAAASLPAGIAREAGDQHVGRHDVAEGEVKRAKRRVVIGVGHGGVAIAHHDGLEI